MGQELLILSPAIVGFFILKRRSNFVFIIIVYPVIVIYKLF